ncbi:MAG TPA: PAS domain S-box protein [Anaerolineaceae bacterium]
MTEARYETNIFRILLVDDDEDDFILTREMLNKARKTQFLLEWAKSFQVGTEAIEANQFDAILVDYDLGLRSGIDFITEATQQGHKEPMILLTGRGGVETDLEAMQAGAAEYLNKGDINSSLLERSIRYSIERKRAKLALQESEERFRLASQAVNGVVYDWNMRTGEVYRSEGLRAMLGFDPAENPASDWWQSRIHPDDRHKLAATYDEMRQTNKSHYESEYRVQKRDGQWIYVQDRILVVRDENNDIARVIGTTIDISQHKKDEEQLRYQAMLLENVKDAIIAIDSQDRITAWNLAAEHLYGWTAAEVLGKDIQHVLFSPAATGEMQAVFSKSENEQPTLLDTIHYGKDGRKIYIEGTMIALRDDEGIITGYVTSNRDITDRKMAEQALQESEATLRSFFNTSSISLAVVEVDFQEPKITYLMQNLHSAAMHGLTPATAAHKTAHELGYREEAIAFWLEKYRACAEGGEPIVIEISEPYTPHAGWYHSTISPIPGLDPDRRRFSVTTVDITDRKQAEEDLRESEQRFRLALSNSNLSVFTMDTDLRYTWSYGARWGYSAAELLGKRDDELEGADDVSELLGFKEEVIRTGVGAQAVLKAKIKGEWLYYNLTLEPLIDEDGHVMGFTAAAVDITNLQRLEVQNIENTTQIEVQRRLIQQREMERMEIARDLHDGPIQELVVAGMKLSEAMLINDGEAKRQLLEELQSILQTQTREMRQFCQELRPPALAPFGLEKAIRSHIQTFSTRRPDMKIKLNLVRDGQLLPEITRMALFRVYQEQMNNIFKHSNCENVIISLQVEPEQVVMEIQDDGVGFSLPDNWIKLVRNGHLGLVGMRERVEAIGGKMEIQSRPDEGTTIRVTAPVVQENQPV